MRQMGDADFLVAREEFPKAEEVLKADGFIIHEESHRHHVGFEKDRMSFEIHFDQPGIPDGVEAWVVRDYFSDILEKSKETSDGSFTWIQPDKFHHGLIMLLHVQRHLLSEGIGLRHLCAWAVFVNAIPEQEFQQIFEERLKKIGLWKFAQTISLTAHLGTGLPRKSWMGKDQSIAQALLKDILSGGNFGSKDRQRAWEGMFISSRGQNSVKHNRIMQAIFSINQNIYNHWLMVKRRKGLLPIGLVLFCSGLFIEQLREKQESIIFFRLIIKAREEKSCIGN